ncbi:MAG: ATP-binding cassette domain-containing protein, partial [Nitrospinota bacterium]
PGAFSLKGFHDSLRFEDVSFRYNPEPEPVLRHIDLTIRKGEVVALVGMSGAGKSTFVDLIPRFHDVSEGRILIDGYDIRDVTRQSLRALIGIVTQEVILFNDTIANNIAYGRADATPEEVVAAAKLAFAHDFIMEMPQGYQSMIGERGVKLSGGQRQRIAIARALLKDAPILILDEATSELDSESEFMLQKAMGNLLKGRTAIVIAHRLSTIVNADRIVVFHQGEIVEMGRHEELLSRGGLYARLYAIQFRGEGENG